MFDVTVLLVLALAAHRLTNLIVSDLVWAATRIRVLAWLHARAGDPLRGEAFDYLHANGQRTSLMANVWPRRKVLWAKIVEALLCKICAGWWVTLVCAAAWRYGGDPARIALVVVAIAGAQNILANRT